MGGASTGYQLWWFYGSTNASGSIGYVHLHVPAPAGCSSNAPCTVPVTVTVSHIYETPGSYDTSFTVYDAQGNYRISTDVVSVVPAEVQVSARSSVSQAEVDQPVGFQASSSVTPAPYANDQMTYEWLFGDNNSSYGNPVSHVFTQAGNYVVRVVATDNRTGAANQTFLDVQVTDPAPRAVITGARTGVEDSPVALSGFASVAPYSDHPFLRYRWNFGNGERGAGANTSTVYTQAGTYQVDLTVTNPLGESSVATRVLTIGDPLPQANAGPAPTVPVGQMAFLNASNSTDVPTDTPFLNYTWQTLNYGETPSNGVIGRQDYFSPGTMDLQLTVRSETGQSVYAGTQVNVQDVAPTVGVYQIYQKVNVSLIVNSNYAEYYQLHLMEWNQTVATGRLFDFPPFATFLIPSAQINISVPYEFQVIYTGPPQAESIANPAMLGVQYEHGGTVWLPVIFTPQESEIWGASANVVGLGQPLFLDAAAFSPAQTGLTTTWDFGDGTSVTQTTSAPGQPEPTYRTLSLVHRWVAGRDYTLRVTTRDAVRVGRGWT
ncbi:PKD domain-containing protein, partial [mine drainage metagenome]